MAAAAAAGARRCGAAESGPWELGAGVLGQIKYRALPAAFDVTEVHRGTPIGPALCRAVLGVQNNQHRKTKASRKRPGLHQAANARCRLVLVGQVPRGQVALVIRGVLRVFGPRGCKTSAAPRRSILVATAELPAQRPPRRPKRPLPPGMTPGDSQGRPRAAGPRGLVT